MPVRLYTAGYMEADRHRKNCSANHLMQQQCSVRMWQDTISTSLQTLLL